MKNDRAIKALRYIKRVVQFFSISSQFSEIPDVKITAAQKSCIDQPVTVCVYSIDAVNPHYIFMTLGFFDLRQEVHRIFDGPSSV